MKGRGNASVRTAGQKGAQFTRDLSEISAVVWMIDLLE
jgi:hypothetical protein